MIKLNAQVYQTGLQFDAYPILYYNLVLAFVKLRIKEYWDGRYDLDTENQLLVGTQKDKVCSSAVLIWIPCHVILIQL